MNSAAWISARISSIACQLVNFWAPSMIAKKARAGSSNRSCAATSPKVRVASSWSDSGIWNAPTTRTAIPTPTGVSSTATPVKNATAADAARLTSSVAPRPRPSAM